MGYRQLVDPNFELVISQQDLAVLRAHVRNRKDTLSKLIEKIIHEWVIHPARLEGNLPLPASNSVLMPGETLRSYLHRSTLAVIELVYKKERQWTRTAAFLGYERSAFYHLYSRLKNGKGTHVFSRELVNESEGLLPLQRVIREHVSNALRLCNGNQEAACQVLGIPLSRLNMILVVARTHTESDLLLNPDSERTEPDSLLETSGRKKPYDSAFWAGRQAFRIGQPVTANPYADTRQNAWLKGYQYEQKLKTKNDDQPLGIDCPGCDVPITADNSGGYRTFCQKCVDAFPPFPSDGQGHLIAEGCRYPNFKWD